MSWLAGRQRFLCCSWQRGDAGEAVEAEECSTRCVPEPSIPRLSKHFSPFSPAASFRCLWLHPTPGLWALGKHGVLMKLNISQWPVPSSGKAGLEPELGLSLGAAWIAGSRGRGALWGCGCCSGGVSSAESFTPGVGCSNLGFAPFPVSHFLSLKRQKRRDRSQDVLVASCSVSCW